VVVRVAVAVDVAVVGGALATAVVLVLVLVPVLVLVLVLVQSSPHRFGQCRRAKSPCPSARSQSDAAIRLPHPTASVALKQLPGTYVVDAVAEAVVDVAVTVVAVVAVVVVRVVFTVAVADVRVVLLVRVAVDVPHSNELQLWPHISGQVAHTKAPTDPCRLQSAGSISSPHPSGSVNVSPLPLHAPGM
jgi:hypothetical protein